MIDVIERAVQTVRETNHRMELFVGGSRQFADIPMLVRLWWEHGADEDEILTVPVQYAIGTAQHESNFTVNEVDIEPPSPSGNIFISKGIFQIADKEAAAHGHYNANLLDLEDSVVVLLDVANYYLGEITNHASKGSDAYDARGQLKPDVWAYLFIAHNQGLAACKKTISRYGINWSAYKQRNLTATANDPEKLKFFQKVARYGDDCINGGTMMQSKYTLHPKMWP